MHPILYLPMASACSCMLFLVGVAVAAAALTMDAVADDMTHLHFYMHDILGGSNPTAVEVVKGPVALSSVPGINFGNLIAIDDALTESPVLSSKPVGRAQGFYMSTAFQEASLFVSANFVFAADGPYNGSALSVMGRDPIAAPVRELSVVGGSGQFRMARGYVLWKTYGSNNTDGILELDFYVTTTDSRGSTPSTAPPGKQQSPVVQQSPATQQSQGSTATSREFVLYLIFILVCSFLI